MRIPNTFTAREGGMAQADCAACGLPFPSTKATIAGPRLLVETGPSFIQLSRHATDRTWDKAVMCTRHAERQLLSEVDFQLTPVLGHLNKKRLRGKGVKRGSKCGNQ